MHRSRLRFSKRGLDVHISTVAIYVRRVKASIVDGRCHNHGATQLRVGWTALNTWIRPLVWEAPIDVFGQQRKPTILHSQVFVSIRAVTNSHLRPAYHFRPTTEPKLAIWTNRRNAWRAFQAIWISASAAVPTMVPLIRGTERLASSVDSLKTAPVRLWVSPMPTWLITCR